MTSQNTSLKKQIEGLNINLTKNLKKSQELENHQRQQNLDEIRLKNQNSIQKQSIPGIIVRNSLFNKQNKNLQ